jgi:hypothetical protein
MTMVNKQFTYTQEGEGLVNDEGKQVERKYIKLVKSAETPDDPSIICPHYEHAISFKEEIEFINRVSSSSSSSGKKLNTTTTNNPYHQFGRKRQL